MSLRLEPAAGGTVFSVRVIPGAGRTALAGEWEEALKIKVGPKPEKGAANRACLEFLAARLRVSRAALVLLKGERARLKVFRVSGLTPAQVRDRLAGREIAREREPFGPRA